MQLFNEKFSSIVLPHNQVDPSVVNHQGLRPSIYLLGLKLGFSIGLTGIHLFNDCNMYMSPSIWVPLLDNNW